MNQVVSNTAASGTPDIQVIDNRGLSVRILQYNRSIADDSLDERVSCSHYGDRGDPLSQIDPRLFSAQQQDTTVKANFGYQTSLSGKLLRTDSIDAGTSVTLFDIEGRPVWSQDACADVHRLKYDPLGRIVTIYDQGADEAAERCGEQFVYVDASADSDGTAQGFNLRGRLVRHYDTAGLLSVSGYSLGDSALDNERQLLADLTVAPDWSGETEATWAPLLSTDIYQTLWQYDALGGTLTQIDAKQNRQRSSVDIAGRPQGRYLTLKDQSEQTLVSELLYNAAGQVLSETTGNGVVTTYGYEPETLRLASMKVVRKNGTVLQDVTYAYDPVGNVLAIDDAAQPVSFFRNQRVTASSGYAYDALYQLLSASGRQNASSTAQGPDLPVLVTDPNNLVNYTRAYTYDRGGNLVGIQHQSDNSYVTEIVVSDFNNHGIAQNDTESLKSSDVDTYFDACGSCLQLQSGQPLGWNERKQLAQVTLLDRGTGNSSDDNREIYRYDGSGARIWKQTLTQNSGIWRTQQVLYLPGLELRTTLSGDSVEETLEVITPNSAGRAGVRVQHWTQGKPVDLSNDQYRYSLGNLIDSVTLELDADAAILTVEEFFPFGGTAVWGGKSTSEVKYKFIRYSGKELDSTGLYYYGHRYYMPWLGRWASADPAGAIDGFNLYRMARNNPVSFFDTDGLAPVSFQNPEDYAMWQKDLKFELHGIESKLRQLQSKHGMVRFLAEKTGIIAAETGVSIGIGMVGGMATTAVSEAVVGALAGTFVGGPIGTIAGIGASVVVTFLLAKAANSTLEDLASRAGIHASRQIQTSSIAEKLMPSGSTSFSEVVEGEVIDAFIPAPVPPIAYETAQTILAGEAGLLAGPPYLEFGTMAYEAIKTRNGLGENKIEKIRNLLDSLESAALEGYTQHVGNFSDTSTISYSLETAIRGEAAAAMGPLFTADDIQRRQKKIQKLFSDIRPLLTWESIRPKSSAQRHNFKATGARLARAEP